MKIELANLTVRDIFKGYKDSGDEGVVGFGGKLNIRPKYQREFIYKDEQRNEVIRTIKKGLPLNVMYWCKTKDGYELMDGQQRTLSFCMYVDGDFSVDDFSFQNLPSDIQAKILDYKLFIYICEGTESEKLEWFKIINIAGEQLTDQELRNAVYAGPWTTDAKRRFSKNGCVAYKKSNPYVKANTIRQELLERALVWLCDQQNCSIEKYMGKHQFDPDALELWQYFSNVIDWIEAKFTNYRPKVMKKVKWGFLYNDHGSRSDLDPAKLEKRIAELMQDDEITKPEGIYEYVLSGNERALSLRTFDDKTKGIVYERQHGICKKCGKHFEITQMEADHITPWSQGGKTVIENCQMLCKDCNRRKSDI